MIKEAIILAGGLGTRLRPVVSDMPKCMAPVRGKPFLNYLIQYLQESGINRFIFSVGYLHEIIENYLGEYHKSLQYQLALENEPLGTGGAIHFACKCAFDKNVLICNGDTLYKIDINALSIFHHELNGSCTLSLKPMTNFDRYGVVELREDHSVKKFSEKQHYSSGLINGGVYALDIEKFLQEPLPQKFSFEKDYLEKNVDLSQRRHSKIYGMVQDHYFIDIGIPEDYRRANEEF